MYYTIYKVTNKVNGKFYIGQHKTKNLDDHYMGSGKLIRRAIEKYGPANFDKEILHVFDNPEDMFAKEAEIVTQDFLQENNTYNLKEGGFGGWYHMNQVPPEQRENIKQLREKIQNGLVVGGTDNWSEDSWNKVRKQGKVSFLGKSHTPEQKQKISEKNKISAKGVRNSQYGKRVYLDPNLKSLPQTNILNSNHRFLPGEQPPGWILISEWKNSRKDKTKGSYGSKWYNDGERNFFLHEDDVNIKELSLKRGRIGLLFR